MPFFNVCFTRTTTEQVSYTIHAESAEKAEAVAQYRLENDDIVEWEPTDFFGEPSAHVTAS